MGITAPPIRTKMIDQFGNLTQPWIQWFLGLGTGTIGSVQLTAETPVGAVDGVNALYQLTKFPADVGLVFVFKNGQKLDKNVGYTIAGQAITIQASYILQPGDSIAVIYTI